MEKKKWTSPQALIVMVIILTIFVYIGVDAFLTKPQIQHDINEVKTQYIELSTFLDNKVPEIDSTFKEHAEQINAQKSQITILQSTFTDLEKE